MSAFAKPLRQAEASEELAHMGYYLCLSCGVPCEVERQGEHDQHCAKCKSGRVQWVPPRKGPSVECRVSSVGFRPRIVPWEPGEEISKQPTKLNLMEAVFKGFWTCQGCGHITQPVRIPMKLAPTDVGGYADGGAEVCGLCGSEKITWNKPVTAEATDGLME